MFRKSRNLESVNLLSEGIAVSFGGIYLFCNVQNSTGVLLGAPVEKKLLLLVIH